MAVQNRRGKYEDFDKTKLVSGEWAVVTSGDPASNSGRSVYMCFEPGQVKRMATYEDMTDNVSNAITDAVKAANDSLQPLVTQAKNSQTAAANSQTEAAKSANAAANSQTEAAKSANAAAVSESSANSALSDVQDLVLQAKSAASSASASASAAAKSANAAEVRKLRVTAASKSGAHTTITATVPDGYSFLCWLGVSSINFIGSPYIDDCSAKTAYIFDINGATAANFYYDAFYLIYKTV